MTAHGQTTGTKRKEAKDPARSFDESSVQTREPLHITDFRDAQTGRFLKGNPGRPLGARNLVNRVFTEAMQELNQAAGMEIILHLLGSPDDKVVLEAYRLILAYGYGKPPDTLNLNPGQSLTDVLREMTQARRAKDDARNGGADAPQQGK